MKEDQKQSLEDYATENERARFDENQGIQRKLNAATSLLRQRDNELESLRGSLSLYEKLEGARMKPPRWVTGKGIRKKNVAVPCMGLGDLHWGEAVNPERIDGINCYGVQVAALRTRRAFEKTILVSRQYMAGLEFEGIHVFLTGDIVSGIIHEELKATNEEEMTESVLGAAEALTAGLKMLADEFGQVYVSAVVGNHSRLSKRMPTKNPQECVDWLVYRMVARYLVDDDRITLHAPKALGLRTSIYQTRYYLTHGTQFKGGSGISGAAAPLLLGAHRATRRAAAAGKPFDIMVCGHFHQAIFWPSKGLIVCGTPKGYDEYAASREMEPEPPQATFWVTTPERGVTFYAPLFCMDRKAEGW